MTIESFRLISGALRMCILIKKIVHLERILRTFSFVVICTRVSLIVCSFKRFRTQKWTFIKAYLIKTYKNIRHHSRFPTRDVPKYRKTPLPRGNPKKQTYDLHKVNRVFLNVPKIQVWQSMYQYSRRNHRDLWGLKDERVDTYFTSQVSWLRQSMTTTYPFQEIGARYQNYNFRKADLKITFGERSEISTGG